MGIDIRKAGVRGQFYPYEAEEIIKMINFWNKKDTSTQLDVKPKAIISPHAGYVYSGEIANKVHKMLSNAHFDTIVVIGPSHHVAFRGISASFYDKYETPFGLIDINKDLLEDLHTHYKFTLEEKAHYLEHSTETQMPFIAYYNSPQKVKVLELIYGIGTSYTIISRIIRYLFVLKKNIGVVISSDLSHFHNAVTAEGIDKACIAGVENQDIKLLQMPCEACGKIGIQGLIKTSVELELNAKVISYTHSGYITGDYNSVVGYMGAIVY